MARNAVILMQVGECKYALDPREKEYVEHKHIRTHLTSASVEFWKRYVADVANMAV